MRQVGSNICAREKIMRVLQLIGGVVLGIIGAALLYFCNRVSFYSYRIGDPASGGSYRNPVVFAILGGICILVAIFLILRGSR